LPPVVRGAHFSPNHAGAILPPVPVGSGLLSSAGAIVLILVDSGCFPSWHVLPLCLLCPRGWARRGVVVAGTYLRTGAGGDHRAAGRRVPQTASRRGAASQAAPGDEQSPEEHTVTREAEGTPRLSQRRYARSPVALRHAHAT